VKLLSKRNTILVIISLVLVSFSIGAFAESRKSKNEDIYHDLEIFAKIIEKVKSYYVDEVDTHELMQKAIDEMLKELDPHSQFLDGLAYEDLMVSTRGQFGGLGIYISFRDNFPTVISPIDDTPADRAGIRGGDQIIEIEGESTDGWRIDKAVGYLRGEPGSDVTFKISRPGTDEAIEYVISREIINVKSVPFYGMFEGKTGYVKVSSFSKRTAEEVEEALDALEAEGMQALVIDFRANPGGLLQAANEVSELFLDKDKLVVYTKGRLANSNRKYYSSNRAPHRSYPVVVMINGASASASEIFAGAMQDWDAGFVVGQTSFGKGTVQTVFNLSETEAVKLTTAKYYTPSGRSIHMDPKDRERKYAEQAVATDGGSEDEMVPINADDEAGTTADVKAIDDDKPVYYTSGGRMVYGGGGITPDLEFEMQRYTDLQRRLERDALAFSFIVVYAQKNEITLKWRVTDEVIAEFLEFIESREFEYKEEDLTEENLEYLNVMLLREAMNHEFGRQAAYRVVTETDPEFQAVIDILKIAPTLKELYQYAEEQKSIKEAKNN